MFAINKIYKDIKKKNPLLYRFLKENKALKKFAINFGCSNEYKGENINNAFTWRLSFEGHYYWSDLNSRYILRKQKTLEKSKLEY